MTVSPDHTKAVRRPLVSADDVDKANYPRARFDKNLAWIIRETAKQRAPDQQSHWRHRVGFAGELATAAYFGVEADWSISPDYTGDDGYDITVNGDRIEVKTVTAEDDWELKVPVEKAESADYFVLARCTNPSELVELVGWTSPRHLTEYGHRFPDDIHRLEPEHLCLFEPVFITPHQIRETQQL